MTAAGFIEQKTHQLIYYIRAFWRGELCYQEIDLFFWDTMEEWLAVTNRGQAPLCSQEQVFWHLMHQIHYWPQEQLVYDRSLREDLLKCIDYLENGEFRPFHCIGIRP